MNSAYKTKTVFTVLNGSTTRKVLQVCHDISKFARGEYQCTPPPHEYIMPS